MKETFVFSIMAPMPLQPTLTSSRKCFILGGLHSYCLLALWVAAAVATAAPSRCGQPSESSPPVTVNGTEHLGWLQLVPTGVDPVSYQFVSYVDGVAHSLSDATCPGGAGLLQVNCSASLPPMSAGAHVLTLTTVLE